MPQKEYKDFELTFESHGMSYIYETELYKHYLPKKSVSIVKNGIVQELMHKEILAEMNKEGLSLTIPSVQDLIKNMNEAVEVNKREIEKTLSAPLTMESITAAFGTTGAVTHAYYFFDPHFFDGIFAESATNTNAAEVVKHIQEYKNVAREDFNQVHFGDKGDIPRLLDCISKESGVLVEELRNYNAQELVKVISGSKISEELLSARKKLYVMQKSDDGKNETVLIGESAETFCKKFYASKDVFGGVLRGKVANAPKAIVRGIVKCITRDYKDVKRMYTQMEEMKDGEILVTQTTDPEMMPALRKAAAAITDIGGMLSHTAITARELGIPCIVDTKFATQILKDGDMVEVDAEKGIVRKIFTQ